MTNFDQKQLRNALGIFATGVTVVTTTSADNHPVGITVNSFTSVSLDPPLILWCLDNEAESYGDFVNCSNFAVHVLHEGQKAVSHCFATKNNDKFGPVEWEVGASGSPLLKDFYACFQCETKENYAAGDHAILLGLVRSIETQQDKKPLIFHAGDYRFLKS